MNSAQLGQERMAYVALVAFQVAMAVQGMVGSKLLSGHSDVPLAAFMLGRHMTATVVLSIVAFFKYGKENMVPYKEDLLSVASAGVLAQWLSPFAYFYGLSFVSATIGSIFDGPLIPLIVYLVALVIGAEALPAKIDQKLMVFGALSLACCGAVMLILASSGSSTETSENFSVNEYFALGALFIEAVGLSVSIVIQKPISKRYPLFSVALWMTFSGLCATVAQCFFLERGGLTEVLALLFETVQSSRSYCLAVVFNALVISVFNASCMAFANSVLPSSLVALAACLQPVFTLAIDVYFFSASCNMQHAVGLAGVSAGLWLFIKHSQPTSQVSVEPVSKKEEIVELASSIM